jgi:uncharacterized membrane protein YkoI
LWPCWQLDTVFTVQYDGKTYEFHVPQDDLKKTAAWTTAQENPPLSVRRAIDIAAQRLATLLPNGNDWRLHAVTLREIDNRWVYLVEFLEPLRPGVEQQTAAGFQLVVLMNGTAVAPRVSQ